jgi:hypothetical protein
VSADPEHRTDKLGLFMLAGLVVLVLGSIVVGTYWTQGVPDKGDVLLGGIATGLILFLRDLVNAIRSSWEEVTRGKTLASLANAGPPASESGPVPKNAQDAADQVADAAVEKADQFSGESA